MGRGENNIAHKGAYPRPTEEEIEAAKKAAALSEEALERVSQFLEEKGLDEIKPLRWYDREKGEMLVVHAPQDEQLRDEITLLAKGVPVEFVDQSPLQTKESTDEDEIDFVFGSNHVTQLGAHTAVVTVATKSDWKDGYLTDDFSEQQTQAIEEAFQECSLEAYQLTEGAWEIANTTHLLARDRLKKHPLFTHEEGVEKLIS